MLRKKIFFSYIQCKFAYGIESKTVNNEEFELQFVSYKELTLTLKKQIQIKSLFKFYLLALL
ncbi:DUF4833 domain-containing protein [Flavobacterium marginilacus]|uniref:DUF4833 domain-containing protein n=1 Tax=Flavobacterium marginilacus TaxID=3003256 RepID=UPI00248DD52F|nr:DUF4833 domain-containing protein [Flavobacterium marginilacus]